MNDQEYIKVIKIIDNKISNGEIKGFKIDINGFTRYDCLIVAAQIVTQMESDAPEVIKASVRTDFLKILNNMRKQYENQKN